MLSLILVEAGLRPSFLIGADVNEIGTNAVWDAGEWLVVEADESYGTFQAIAPDLAVLTNVEADHLDHYGTFDALRAAFADFVAGARTGCGRVRRRSRGGGHRAAARRRHRRDGPGCRPTSWRDLDLQRSSVVVHPARARRRAGPAARRRARACTTPATRRWPRSPRSRSGAPFAAAQAALARFAGVTRRFEFRGEADGVTFVDDYAHLPDGGARRPGHGAERAAGRRVVAVFQPHRYTRTAALARAVRHRLRRRRRAGRDRRLRRRASDRSRASRAGWSPTPSGPRTRACR